MAEDIEFRLEGLDSLLGKLDAVSYDVRRKGGRAALRKAAQLVAGAARQGAERLNDPETSREIAKNITLRWNGRLFKQRGDLGFRVGILGGAKQKNNYHTRRGRAGGTYEVGGDSGNPGGDTYYWRFLEFGTAKMAAQPFMRNALAENIAAATDAFISEYERAIDRAIRRAAKKAGK
jgi:HK97 gp10 family phage protein